MIQFLLQLPFKKKNFEPLLMLSFALLYNEPTLVGKYIYELAIGT